ncbi:hypothetical protein Tco_0633179 [Tanacetum coccineum]
MSSLSIVPPVPGTTCPYDDASLVAPRFPFRGNPDGGCQNVLRSFPPNLLNTPPYFRGNVDINKKTENQAQNDKTLSIGKEKTEQNQGQQVQNAKVKSIL